jgi:hypothetical protein
MGPIPLNADPAVWAGVGIAYPNTENGWRWTYRQRHQRGLAHCFLKIGKRVLVDPQAYLQALAAQRTGETLPLAPSSGRLRRSARQGGAR